MPTLNMTISLPTQAEVDDFCTATGYVSGSKGDFVKTVIARYIKQVITSYRVSEVRKQADVTIKTIHDQNNTLIIE
jgi:hypothetical protein